MQEEPEVISASNGSMVNGPVVFHSTAVSRSLQNTNKYIKIRRKNNKHHFIYGIPNTINN